MKTVRLGVFVWASFLWSYNTEKKETFVWLLPDQTISGCARPFQWKDRRLHSWFGELSKDQAKRCRLARPGTSWGYHAHRVGQTQPFSSQPIRLWDRMIRMIQETQETTDFLDFLWNIKTVIHWNLWGWQLGTVRSTSASVGVPGALSCVCHMSHMSYIVFAKEMRFKTLLIWDVRRQWSDFFSSVKVVAIFAMMGVSKFGQDNLRN